MFDFIVCSDGGSGADGTAAAASIVRISGRPAKKLVALLGQASSYEAELAAGILGLSWALSQLDGQAGEPARSAGPIDPKKPNAIWFCDHHSICSQAADLIARCRTAEEMIRAEGEPAERLWSMFAVLASRVEITIRTPDAGGRLSRVRADHQRCDRVCRWVYTSADRLLEEFGTGPIGQTALHDPQAAWELSDLRGQFKADRSSPGS